MKLFTWGFEPKPEDHPNKDALGWEWAFEIKGNLGPIDKFRPTIWAGAQMYIIYPTKKIPVGRYYLLQFNTGHWYWGEDHIYYDGPHCFFGLGWLGLSWGPHWCNKCSSES